MDRNTPTLSKPLRGAYNLLLVSVVGIASCSICILIYHFLLVKYLKWRRRNNNNIVPPLHTLADTSVNGVDQFYGIDQKLLESIPIIIYSVNNRCAFCLVQTECAVCLGELEEVDRVRVLPGCRHVFHVTCIDEWLKGHVNCPLCRSPLDGPVADIFIDLPIEIIGGDDVASDDTETPHNLMIRHCTSMVLSRESEEIEFFEGKFKRSVSMDQLTVTHAEKRSLELV